MENKNSKICILDTETSNQIAAGEVVERPVSVVKELVENAIDAGAKRVTVSLEQDFTEDCIKKIEVADDGIGMSRADLETAFYRHATSKIRKIDDLNFVLSLGFRGEALPSIASVSKVSVKSRSIEEISGHTGSVIDGRMVITGESGMPVGTKITVDDLFYNTPARKKFLKSAAVEQGRITALISNMILSSPQVAFILKVDGRTVLHSSGNGSLQQAVVAVYGAANLSNLAEVSYQTDNLQISGLVSRPPFARSSRKYYHFFVNGRLVKSRELSCILELAYETLLPERRYPMGIIYLNLNPGLIDVNVHPAKTEIRFREPAAVKDAMLAAVKDALAPKIKLEPSKAKADEQKKEAVSTPQKAEQNIKQNLADLEIQSESGKSFKLGDLFSFGGDSHRGKKQEPEIKPEPKQSFFEVENETAVHRAAENISNPFSADLDMKASKESDFTSKLFGMLVGIDGGRDKAKTEEKLAKPQTFEKTEAKTQSDEIPNPYEIYNEYLGYNDDSGDNAAEKASPMAGLNGLFNLGALLGNEGASKKTANKIEGEQEEIFKKDVNLFQALKPLGQLNASYIIAVLNEDLYIIDQHAAHERILYEEFCQSFGQNKSEISMLAVPVTVELGDLPKEMLLQNLEAVSDFGFTVEYLGGSTFVLRGVPLWFAQGKDNENVRRSDSFSQSSEDFFLDIMDRVVGNVQGEDNAVNFSDLNKEELFTMACKNAVKANQYLTDADISWLLQRLSRAEKPQTCPHGRPTVIKISDGEIRKRFMRS
ncbi:MAG: DNA mismatch repair endonuclease MutL [Bacillota bacterium]